MALTKTINIDQITIIENGTILYREVSCILEDGIELSKTYHRTTLAPANDLTNVPDNVVAIANITWTPEVISAYQAQVELRSLGAV